MAEGDSIHRLAARLRQQLVGATVQRAEPRTSACVPKMLDGRSFESIEPLGKHVLMRLGGTTLHSHLRMQGRWTVLAKDKRLPPHLEDDVRLRLHLDDGRTVVALAMPVLETVETSREADVIGHLGPDILATDFDAAAGCARLQNEPGVPAVQALLDQRNVCGPGNLWVIETLFLRGVQPWREIGSVECESLLALMRKMMVLSRDTGNGMVTTGVRRKGQTHWVYGRYRRPCRRCGTPVCFSEGGTGPYDREVWWCPSCQPVLG